MKISLQKPKPYGYANHVDPWWKESEPFVLNDRAILIHRPRIVSMHHSRMFGSHISIKLWCGQLFSGSKEFTFLAAPPQDRLLCEACELRAVMAGFPSSSELAGRHVCTGKVRAFNSCPVHGESPNE